MHAAKKITFVTLLLLGLATGFHLATDALKSYLLAEPDWAQVRAHRDAHRLARQIQNAQWQQSRWDDRCTDIQCNDFPIGYETLQLDGDVYYFPFQHVVEHRAPDVGNHAALGYLQADGVSDFDENQKIKRSFIAADYVSFSRGFPALFGWFTVDDKDLAIFTWGSMYLRVFSASRWNWMEESFYEYVDTVSPPSEIDDEVTARLASVSHEYSDDYVRLEGNFRMGSYGIISKEPRHRGLYIVGHCRIDCDFFTVRPRKNDSVDGLMFSLNQVPFPRRPRLSECDGRHKGFEAPLCPEGVAYLKEVEDVLKMIDQMFEAASAYPEPR